MGEIVRLDEHILFPTPDGDEIKWPYFRTVLDVLADHIGGKTNTTINIILDRTGNTEIYYFGIPDESGVYPEGTWRIYAPEDGSYLRQVYESGSWTTIDTLTPDGLLTGGGFGMSSASVATTYTVAEGIYSVLCDSSSSSFNVTLPTLTGKRSVRISVDGSNPVTAVGTINGETNLVMYDGETWDFTDNLTEWRV
jgi:hypothetical protein